MRSATIVLALVAAGAVAAPVTYRTVGATARDVIEQTAAQAREKWAVDNELAREIVIINVDKVEPEVFRAKLASVLSGEWVRREDGSLVLENDPTETKRRHELAQKVFVRGVRSRVDKMITDLDKIAFREGSLRIHELSRLQPLYILKQVDDGVFEKLRIGERVVLSTHPNRVQSALPSVLPKLNELADERMRRMQESAALERPGSLVMPGHPITTAVIAIERLSGEELGIIHSIGGGGGFQAILPEYRPVTQKSEGKPIAWSPVSIELSRLYRNPFVTMASGAVAISSQTAAALRNPVANELLSYAFGEGILAYAESKGQSVVACMPDDDFHAALAFSQDRMTTDDFIEQVRSRLSLTIQAEGSWLLVYPSDPAASRKFRGDRAALKTLIDSSPGRMYPALDTLAEFAASHLPRWRLPIPFQYTFAAVIGSDGGGVSAHEYLPTTWRGLQLYHTLTPSLRTRLRNGEELNLAALPAASKDVLSRMIFGVPQPSFGEYPEPTVSMPNGLPNDGRIRAEVSIEPILAPLPDGGEFDTPPTPLGPRQVAFIRISQERNEPTISLHRVRLGERVSWRFTIFAPDGTVVGKTAVCEDNVDPKGKILTMSQLPDEITKAHREAERIERIRLFGGE